MKGFKAGNTTIECSFDAKPLTSTPSKEDAIIIKAWSKILTEEIERSIRYTNEIRR